MTKKDFILIAEMLRDVPQSLCLDDAKDREKLARHAAGYLAMTNPRFDRTRFITAATQEG